MKLGKQNQYIITDNVVVGEQKHYYYDDLQGFCVGSDISKLKVLKTLFKIVRQGSGHQEALRTSPD